MKSLTEYNPEFLQAAAFIKYTDKSIFLTGNAGTGKTTFLKYINKTCLKKKAIIAPTGVAAINAEGMTIHSLFLLPFGAYIANYEINWKDHDNSIYNKQRLLGNLRLRKERRKLIQELELLIIDEVSMLRADLLDAIDTVLKSVRRDARPFGGLQVLFIGDLYQLPPVVKTHEWAIMRNYYKSPFFFDAHIIQEAPLIQLELTKIYRQSDPTFISLLNNIRRNTCSDDDLKLLNHYYRPDYNPSESENYITLCSHNAHADAINQKKIKELNTKSTMLKAAVNGNFAENAYPAESDLELKIGAQVMFLKNDKGIERRYYNGTIAIVKQINRNEVIVELLEGRTRITVEREKWENIRYKFNAKKDKVDEEVLGTFSQFPLRLAWAVTIHKSQGLTFERAVIDAGSAFAAGQVYVALSRVKSLKGLVLLSKIKTDNIRSSIAVQSYTDQIIKESEVSKVLQAAQHDYLISTLINTFRWDELRLQAASFKEEMLSRNIPNKRQAYILITAISIATDTHADVADKFRRQLSVLIQDSKANAYKDINKRIVKAYKWFGQKLDSQIIFPLEDHIKEWKIKPRTKKYISDIHTLLSEFIRQKTKIKHSVELIGSLVKGKPLIDLVKELEQKKESSNSIQNEEGIGKAVKSQKGESQRISLELFKSGKSIQDIASARSLTEGTIQGHLISFIGLEIEATDLIEIERLETVTKAIKANPDKSANELRMLLGNGYSYADIRIGRLELGRGVRS